MNGGMANQLMAISMIKGQLEDIHSAIEATLMNQITRPTNGFKYNKPVELSVKINIVNVSKTEPEKLVVEELQRLRSLTDSLGETIDYMRDCIGSQSIESGK